VCSKKYKMVPSCCGGQRIRKQLPWLTKDDSSSSVPTLILHYCPRSERRRRRLRMAQHLDLEDASTLTGKQMTKLLGVVTDAIQERAPAKGCHLQETHAVAAQARRVPAPPPPSSSPSPTPTPTSTSTPILPNTQTSAHTQTHTQTQTSLRSVPPPSTILSNEHTVNNIRDIEQCSSLSAVVGARAADCSNDGEDNGNGNSGNDSACCDSPGRPKSSNDTEGDNWYRDQNQELRTMVYPANEHQ
jgi:hypothetical protein